MNEQKRSQENNTVEVDGKTKIARAIINELLLKLKELEHDPTNNAVALKIVRHAVALRDIIVWG